MKKILVTFFLFLLFFDILYSHKISQINNFYLEQKGENFLGEPISFFVTNKGQLFVLDRKKANVKIYDKKGKLLKVFGRRGRGPDEFINLLSFSHYKNNVLIYDFRMRSLYNYEISKKNNLIYKRKIKFESLAPEIQYLNKDKILVTGEEFDDLYAKSRKSYNLFIYDLKKNERELLLNSLICYNVKSQKEADELFVNNFGLIPIGDSATFSSKYFFYVQNTKLRIIRLSRKNRKIYVFGKNSKNFKSPFIDSEIKKAVRIRRTDLLNNAIKKMSFVIKLFCINEKKIGLLYTNYNNINKGQEIYMQIYDIQGKFIKEFRLLQTKSEYITGIKAYYKKDENILYILSVEEAGFSDLKFKIHKYKIIG